MYCRHSMHLTRLFVVIAVLAAFLAAAPGSTSVAGPAASPGVLAYVRPNDATGDEIWLVRSNGSEDRRIFTTGKPDLEKIHDIGSLAWKKDGTELAFDSSHEFACSFYARDVFSIRPTGTHYRRITQSPGCAALAGYPQGSVTVPVKNNTLDSVVAFIYFQGARDVQMVTLPPGGSASVTFDEVADLLGADPQAAIAISGAGRDFNLSSADVIPGQHVTATPSLSINGLSYEEYGATWPTWRATGDFLAYVVGGMGLLYRIPANPPPLELGEFLIPQDAETPLFMRALEYGPTAARASQFIYLGWDVTDQPGIYLTTEGATTAGQKLVELEGADQFTGVAWAPDGSAIVYSRTEPGEFGGWMRANVYEYSFATGQTRKLSDLPDGKFAADLSVSADGQHIAFEVSNEADKGPYDLWLMNRDGSNQRLFRPGAQSPAWSPVEPPAAPALRDTWLPLILKR